MDGWILCFWYVAFTHLCVQWALYLIHIRGICPNRYPSELDYVRISIFGLFFGFARCFQLHMRLRPLSMLNACAVCQGGNSVT